MVSVDHHGHIASGTSTNGEILYKLINNVYDQIRLKIILAENNNIFPQVYFTKFMEELETLPFQEQVLTPMSLVHVELPATET